MAEHLIAFDSFHNSVSDNICCKQSVFIVDPVLYGVDFVLINFVLFVMARLLIRINPDEGYLKDALDVKNAIVIPSIFFIVGLIVALMGHPIAISICCLITIIRSIVYSLK